MDMSFGSRVAYQPPNWLASNIPAELIPCDKLCLGRFPTPVHKLNVPSIDELGIDLWIKRDDLSSCDLSGNKVRKLEFLLAAATKEESGHDCLITIGGLQSNHARATAVAARQVGLDPYLILRKPLASPDDTDKDENIGLTGNLLYDRIIGADIRLVTPSTYACVGCDVLCEQLAEDLKQEGRNPYIVPMGGSNALGAFGYIECLHEIMQSGVHYDHIVFGCGSGGTAAGVALGVKLAGLNTQVHAVGVCDTPEYFYNHLREVANELKIDVTRHGQPEQWCHIYQGQGRGYARSTEPELDFIIQLAQRTGIILDPVYSGKALYQFVQEILPHHYQEMEEEDDKQNTDRDPVFKKGQKVLFIHTGGTAGLYDKEKEIIPLLRPSGKVSRMDVRLNK